MSYHEIFAAHILRIQEERRLTKQEMGRLGGVSAAFMTDLARGEANPTLKTMEAFSEALGIPLPLLLRPLDSEEWRTILSLSTKQESEPVELPPGYGILEKGILPLHKIYVVEQWIKAAHKTLRTLKKN